MKKHNILSEANPELASEWHPTLNGNLKPTDITAGSNKKVWWKCSNGHEWDAKIYSRNSGKGCPICAKEKRINSLIKNKILKSGSLQTTNPKLAAEWHPTLNGGLKPTDVTANSGEKVWWFGKCGHEWDAKIYSRNSGNGCPICASEKHTSYPEFAIYYFLQQYASDIIHTHKDFGFELDLYIPSKNVAIEYDGYFWHKNKAKQDKRKNKKCQELGIKLYRVRELLSSLNDTSVDFYCDTKNLDDIISKLIKDIFSVDVKIDISAHETEINNLRTFYKKENSLAVVNPKLAAEWHPTLNDNLKPTEVTAGGAKRVWWQCSKGHEWKATITHRNNGSGCPYCSNQKVLAGFNDLQTANPELAAEWHPALNDNLKPTDVTAGSPKKVWWLGKCGHEWDATIKHRNNGRGCPYCSGNRVLIGFNDLKTTNPKLAAEWHPTKNGNLKPTDFTAGSGKKVWWQCSKGHEWDDIINNRNKGYGCPYCSGRRKLPEPSVAALQF